MANENHVQFHKLVRSQLITSHVGLFPAGNTWRIRMSDKTAQLNIDGKSFDFQIKSGVIGPDVIDISSLYAQTGMFTYDPGFTSTASCNSEITFIDGGKGQLLHRGYAIESLARIKDQLN